jgi:molecular chaperone DnaK (HSP70)
MKPGAETRKPYSGTTRSLVLALDVGTTFSGVSYAILEPNEVPKIHGVTRFPGQEHVAGNSKIPSIMYYDKRGRLMAAGAEAENASIISQADDEGWTKAELYVCLYDIS